MRSRAFVLFMLLMIMISMAACEKAQESIKRTEDHYSAERILPEDFGFFVSASFEEQSSIYLDGGYVDEPGVSVVWRFDTETNELNKTVLHRDKNRFPGEKIKSCFMDSGYVGEDGSYSIMCMSFQGMEDERHDFFKYTYDLNGELYQVTDLTDYLQGFFEGLMTRYPMNIVLLPGEVLFTYSEEPLVSNFVCMEESGKVAFDTKLDGFVLDVQICEDGRILVLEKIFRDNVVNLLELDRKTGKKKILVKNIKNTDTGLFAGGNDPDKIYFLTDEGLMQCDLNGRNVCEIFRLSDVNVARAQDIKAITQISDGSWCALMDAGGKTDKKLYMNYNFFRIRKTEAATRELTLALTDAEPALLSECREAAALFNRFHNDVRIVVKNYDSIEELVKEITAGKIPDLVDVSDASIEESLGEKELLEDLRGFLDRDEELSETDFLKKALEIYEKDGKLWAIPESVSVMALIGNEDYLADREGWTFDEFKDFIGTLPDPTASRKYLVRNDFLKYVCPLLLSHFVDLSAGNCHFETEEFYELLEFIKNCSENEYGEMQFERFYDEIRSGEFRMIMAGITGIQDYELLLSMYSHNGKVIGFPSDDGNGIYIIPEGVAPAITTTCPEKEIAWEFVKFFLSEEAHVVRGIPTYVPEYESMIREARQEVDHHEPQMQLSYGNVYLDIPYADEKDIDAFEKLFGNGFAIKAGDDTILQIILEEAQSYFKGRSTVGQVAERIQNRVQLYLDEK